MGLTLRQRQFRFPDQRVESLPHYRTGRSVLRQRRALDSCQYPTRLVRFQFQGEGRPGLISWHFPYTKMVESFSPGIGAPVVERTLESRPHLRPPYVNVSCAIARQQETLPNFCRLAVTLHRISGHCQGVGYLYRWVEFSVLPREWRLCDWIGPIGLIRIEASSALTGLEPTRIDSSPYPIVLFPSSFIKLNSLSLILGPIISAGR